MIIDNESKKPKIGVLGLSHLGIVTSIGFAAKGFEVIGVDINQELVLECIQGRFPIQEPLLDETFAKARDYLKFTIEFETLKSCDLIYIAKDVPTDSNGNSDLHVITELISLTSNYYSENAVVVILCQVSPGFARKINESLRQKIVYQVETLVFGNAINRALFPERLIIGKETLNESIDPSLLVLLESFKCPIVEMNYESAELTKIAINLFLASSVTTTNALTEICEKIGADWSQISPALKLDERIGPKSYTEPGLGISGGNIERDIRTIINLGLNSNTDVALFDSFIENSNNRKNWPIYILNKLRSEGFSIHRIAIWGLAYKKDTNSIKNSPAIYLIEQIYGKTEIVVTDPVVNLPKYLTSKVKVETDPLKVVRNADCLLVMTDWAKYYEYSLSEIINLMRIKIVIDPFGIFANKIQNLDIIYFRLGLGNVK